MKQHFNKDGCLDTLNKIVERANYIELIENLEYGKIIISKVVPKLEKEEKKYEEIKKCMEEISNIFYKNTITRIKETIFKKFLNLFQSEELFYEELNKLKSLFKIKENENLDYLVFNFKNEFLKKIIFSYENILQKLNLNLNIISNIEK